MATDPENLSLALFCDFENIALGVRDAKYAKFDIERVLERLLVKGSIVVKKAYCDWERYKEFKPAMHEAAFELIEIPPKLPLHLRRATTRHSWLARGTLMAEQEYRLVQAASD